MSPLEAVIRSAEQTAGPRPHFLTDPDSDRLLAMVLALAGQLTTVYERLDTVTEVLARHGLLDLAELDDFEPGPETSRRRMEWDEAFVRRLLRVLTYELESAKAEPRPGV
ncbi:MAG TPA: hypothetical protein VL460_06000 [Caulobacteraceae bacterium]|jgi:hypothetical protein|nr:hypothetical protein [Caulobacteraceae bacterium]